MSFFIIRQDITKMQVDAIVNTANTNLLQGSGTSRAIYLAAGEEELTKACEEIGFCEAGKAVITDGFRLPAKYIIHAVGPVWKKGKWKEQEILYSAYMESLKLAKRYNLYSIAFPLISTGFCGYPKDEALKIAKRAIGDFLQENDMEVYLVIYDKNSLEICKKLFVSIEEYIDEQYVENNDEGMPAGWRKEKVSGYITNIEDTDTADIVHEDKQIRKEDLDVLINQKEESFSQMLLRLIDEKKMTDTQVYKKANVDRKLFSKIRNNKDYSPSKKTVFCFAIALELSFDETKVLLQKAGFAFSNSSKFDVVVSYFIRKKKYDIFEINEILFQYNLPILG